MKNMLVLVLIVLMITVVIASAAETTWRLVTPQRDLGDACLHIGGESVGYHRLDASDPVVLRVKGPRRVKIVTRYLFAPGEGSQPAYTVTAAIDGRLAAVRPIDTKAHRDIVPCSGEGRVGVLKRSYVTVPSGWHDVMVTADAPGSGAVAARFLREVRKKPTRWVSYSPERYRAVNHLQFDSGSRTAYYLFDAATPLVAQVKGPTTLKIWTRLDFDHTMSGVQPYAIEVRLDGEAWRTYQYDADRLDSARWVERDDVLPGERKTMTLKIPRGPHRIELRCLRPAECGMAASVRIPERDIR